VPINPSIDRSIYLLFVDFINKIKPLKTLKRLSRVVSTTLALVTIILIPSIIIYTYVTTYSSMFTQIDET
jgi:hypothetical protein